MKNLKYLIVFIAILLSFQIVAQNAHRLIDVNETKSIMVDISDDTKFQNHEETNLRLSGLAMSEISLLQYISFKEKVFNDFNQQNSFRNKDLRIELTFFGAKYWKGDLRINKHDLIFILESVPEAELTYSSGKSMRDLSLIVAVSSGAVLGWQTSVFFAGESLSITALSLGGVGIGGAILLNLVGRSKMRKSIDIYNKNYTRIGVKPLINSHGIGLSISL